MVFWIFCRRGWCPYVCMHVAPASPIVVLFHTLFLVSHPGLGYGRGRHYISKVCGGIYDLLLSEQRSICRARNFNFIVPFLALGNGKVIAWLLGASHLSMRESCKKSSSNKDPSFGLQLLLQKCRSHGEQCTKQIHLLFPSQQDKVNSSFSKCVSHCFHYVFDVSAGGIGIYGQR